MTDIEKLLTEAGFKSNGWVTDRYKPYFRWIGEWAEIVRVPHNKAHMIEVCGWTTEANLSTIILALQGKVALTEEEREAIDLALVIFGYTAGDKLRPKAAQTAQRAIATLRNLLTRSTADAVSLAAVDAALRQALRGVDWFEASPEEVRQDIMDRLTSKHHQEGERDQ